MCRYIVLWTFCQLCTIRRVFVNQRWCLYTVSLQGNCSSFSIIQTFKLLTSITSSGRKFHSGFVRGCVKSHLFPYFLHYSWLWSFVIAPTVTSFPCWRVLVHFIVSLTEVTDMVIVMISGSLKCMLCASPNLSQDRKPPACGIHKYVL